MLKSVFTVLSEAAYYQGLNDVMGLVQREFKTDDAMQIFEGLVNDRIWYVSLDIIGILLTLSLINA